MIKQSGLFINIFLIFLIIGIAFFSCEKQGSHIQTDKTTLHMDQDDEELAQIAIQALDTLPDFFRRLLRPGKDENNFMVKYPFKADRYSGFNMEQLWLSNIRFKDGIYYGTVANTPFYVSAIKKGDTVTFNAGDITDWMYTSGDKIIGGHSIKHLLEQIPEHSEEQQRIMEMFTLP